MSRIPPSQRGTRRPSVREERARGAGFFQGMEHYESLVKRVYAQFHGEAEVDRFLAAVHKTTRLAEDGSPLTPVHELSYDEDGNPRLELVTHLPLSGESPSDAHA